MSYRILCLEGGGTLFGDRKCVVADVGANHTLLGGSGGMPQRNFLKK